LQGEKISPNALFIVLYYERFKGYVTKEKARRGENYKRLKI